MKVFVNCQKSQLMWGCLYYVTFLNMRTLASWAFPRERCDWGNRQTRVFCDDVSTWLQDGSFWRQRGTSAPWHNEQRVLTYSAISWITGWLHLVRWLLEDDYNQLVMIIWMITLGRLGMVGIRITWSPRYVDTGGRMWQTVDCQVVPVAPSLHGRGRASWSHGCFSRLILGTIL